MSLVLVTPKINPDLDGVACAYALVKILNANDPGNKYLAGIFGEPQSEANFLLEKFQLKSGLVFDPVDHFDQFIIVDASDIIGMPQAIRALDVVEVIDHRSVTQAKELFPQAKIQIEAVGAAATLIVEKAQALEFSLDLGSLTLLFGAIYSNTLNLQPSIATERDLAALRFCEEQSDGKLSPQLVAEMFNYKTKYLDDHLGEVMASDFKGFTGSLGIAQLEGFDLDDLVATRLVEIKSILARLQIENDTRRIFLNACDLNRGHSIFVAPGKDTELMLAKALNVSFDTNGVARNDRLILRKQILPLLE
ncbi:MAG: DHH family phosphoesterase [Candidatus Falkowbacteria bacterium]|nr:DHH family phosphoesterase [Candidatus Falkowbacteria bacterium]